MIEGKRRDKEDSLVVEEGMIFKLPLVPFAAPASRFFPARRGKTTTSYRYTKTQHNESAGDS